MKTIELLTIGKDNPKPRLDFPGKLRPWQRDAYEKLVGEHQCVILAPTGSGKSLLQRALASHWMKKEGCHTLIAVPQNIIKRGFAAAFEIELPDGSVLKWPKIDDDPMSGDELVAWSQDRGIRRTIAITTHLGLVRAYDKGMRLDNICLVLDECHHSATIKADDERDDEVFDLGGVLQNRINEVVDTFMVHDYPLVMATATWLRSNDWNIVKEEHKKLLAVYQLPAHEYLLEAGLKVHVRFWQGNFTECMHALHTEPSQRTIIWQPTVKSNICRLLGGKDKVLDEIRSIFCGDICDMVTVEGRTERKEELFRRIDDGTEPDTIVALNIGKEGFDCPRLSRGVVVGYRRSLVSTIQMMGRLLRAAPGKTIAEFNIVLPIDGKPTVEELHEYLDNLVIALAVGWYFERNESLDQTLESLTERLRRMMAVAHDVVTGRQPKEPDEDLVASVREAVLLFGQLFTTNDLAVLKESFEVGRVPEEKKQEILRLYVDEGLKVMAISVVTGVDRGRVTRILTAAGVYRKTRTMKNAARSPNDIRAEVHQLHHEGLSVHEIAKRADLYVAQVQLHLGMEVDRNPARSYVNVRRQKQAVIELREQGKSMAEIASLLDLTVGQVGHALKEQRKSRPRRHSKLNDDIRHRVVQLAKLGIEHAEIAAQVNQSTRTVRKLLAAAGLYQPGTSNETRAAQKFSTDPSLRPQVLALVAKGVKLRDIAQKLRVSHSLVSQWYAEAKRASPLTESPGQTL